MCAHRRPNISRFTCWLLLVVFALGPRTGLAQHAPAEFLRDLRPTLGIEPLTALTPLATGAPAASCAASWKPAGIVGGLVTVSVAAIVTTIAAVDVFSLRSNPRFADGQQIALVAVGSGVTAGAFAYWRDCRRRRGRT